MCVVLVCIDCRLPLLLALLLASRLVVGLVWVGWRASPRRCLWCLVRSLLTSLIVLCTMSMPWSALYCTPAPRNACPTSDYRRPPLHWMLELGAGGHCAAPPNVIAGQYATSNCKPLLVIECKWRCIYVETFNL